MFIRALLAFLALPGLFAFVLPWLIAANDTSSGEGNAIGIVVAAIGLAVLLWCVRDFYVAGKGTLAPWDPPKHLVIVGLYRFARNPMYAGVLTFVAGWSVTTGSLWLTGYLVALAIAFHLRVLLFEEPRLSKQFGAQWETYAANVSRWLPRLTPWHESAESPSSLH